MVSETNNALLEPKVEPEETLTPDSIEDAFIWNESQLPKLNYTALGQRLASTEGLYRNPSHAGGLIHVLPDLKHAFITKGVDLFPLIVDRVPVRVIKDGKLKGGKIDAVHLNAMLKAEAFLEQFLPVDQVSTTPMYLGDFMLTRPGYNGGGVGQRVLYLGGQPQVSNSMETIGTFLDVMAFDTPADRTNAVAAALTVLLRNHWPGGKPIVCVTATKSHAGKDTVLAFATGTSRSVSISYQATNWALEHNANEVIRQNPDVGVLCIENARLEGRERFIASDWVERWATDPDPMLCAPGTGPAVRRKNDIVLAISTNFGSVSEDILNRSLPIHLAPVGNVADRQSPIGNPRFEFLPQNKERIAAELHGMVRRWKEAGQPLDEDVRHPSTVWARIIGGILKVNGFADFLANYGERKTADDPVRQALGILGAAHPDEWLGSGDWARLAADLGLTKTIIPRSDQDSDAGRQRGMGVALSAHQAETFTTETDNAELTLRLEKVRRRWDGGEPQVRYRFVILERRAIPEGA